MRARYQQSAQRFAAFFNRLTKARLAGMGLATALADAVGHELSTINAAADLPPEAQPMWADFLARYLGLPGTAGKPPADPLARLRALPEAQAEEAMSLIGDIQASLTDALKKTR
jgi:hypothetical protein